MEYCYLSANRCLYLNVSLFWNAFGKASLILRLSFGYASIVPSWEKGLKSEGVIWWRLFQQFDLIQRFRMNLPTGGSKKASHRRVFMDVAQLIFQRPQYNAITNSKGVVA